MLNNKFTTGILITVMSTAIIGLVLVLIFIFGNNYPIIATDVSIIEFNLDDGSEQVIEFQDLEFVPGSMNDYTVKINTKESNDYILSFLFFEKEESKLKEYIHVKIVEEDDKVVFDMLLSDIIKDDKISYLFYLDEETPKYFDIIYYMDETVGNEAKGLEMTFDLIVSADIQE